MTRPLFRLTCLMLIFFGGALLGPACGLDGLTPAAHAQSPLMVRAMPVWVMGPDLSSSTGTSPAGPASATPDSLPDPASPLDEATDPSRWRVDLMGKLRASQSAYSNWTEGGLNTLALATNFDGEVQRQTANWEQAYRAQLRLGFLKQDTLTVRKAEDRLQLTSELQYRGSGFFRTFNPTIATQLRTQFIAGFNYSRNPFDDGRDPPVRVSNFFSPATFTQSLGLTYEPEKGITQRLSLGAKQVIVAVERLQPLYGLDVGDGMRYEAGIESRTAVDREVFKDVHVQSTLSLFAAFNRDDAPDMQWENMVVLEFNKWISLDFELTTLYDRDVVQAFQVKEVVALGASIDLL